LADRTDESGDRLPFHDVPTGARAEHAFGKEPLVVKLPVDGRVPLLRETDSGATGSSRMKTAGRQAPGQESRP
jgi:hypothetical protein